MNEITQRRANLDFLVIAYDTQTLLANVLVGSKVTQPIISSILNAKRALRPHEARAIERKLGIPRTWMDRLDLKNG